MANHLFFFLFSLSILLFFHGGLARPGSEQQQQNQCQLNSLEAREPDNRIECEAGQIESWNPNQDEFQCAGVAVARYTIEQNGLHLPSYTNAPHLIHIIQGSGLLGVIFPGCPETFEESQQQTQQQWQGQQGQKGRSQQGQQGRDQQGQSQYSSQQEDRHQKIRRVREGDIIAIPAGVAYWTYNQGDQQLVAVHFLHTDNEDNQLDQNPRRFYLAGNPEDEFNQQQSRQGRSQQRREQGQQGNGNNVYSGFDTKLLADSLNIDEDTAEKIQCRNDNRRNIIRVQGQLDLVNPRRSQQERQEEQRLQQELQQERQQQGRRNGLEETFCSARLKENIADPSRADVFSPQAGRISTVNNFNLPILRSLGLSAERGFLYRNGIYTPHWNINAHSVIYAIRGRARVQVVDDNGNNLFDNELREGQVLTVPQNFAVLKKASNEGFEWVAFKTNENAKISPLAGRISVLRALPDDVVSNVFQLSRDEAKQVKFNRRQVSLLDSSSSSQQQLIRAVA
ncbi:hypothetical protein FNV43_RR23240 [Rhamnella rubrinervis]|uniref:11S seed storage protein n=1 Tax=Rhamnella rubrinervis TaxID=2594499 RepID=A0A8K0DVS9_9ROSA|nr:hypothetical protein FNV43_RR23240 [Rhamnella rubrinervis]